MIRVLLVNPPSPERLGLPLLGLQYVAASLLSRGCEVRVIDAAARRFDQSFERIISEAWGFAPDLLGFSLTTRWVRHAYLLAERLRGCARLMVAGGPHATVRPDEVLRHGFDVAVLGEAEETILRLVDYLQGRTQLDAIPGIRFRKADGTLESGPPGQFVRNLDGLPFPHLAQPLFDPRWYDPSGAGCAPLGMLASRGCPSHCTFCANYVTGRRLRYRSPANVIAELNARYARWGGTFYPFWDDAMTAHFGRIRELLAAFEGDGLQFPLLWSAITRVNLVNPELLEAMKRAGCVAVNFGVESGDDEILKLIQKGITTGQAVRALEWARRAGLRTIANFMLGFPQEGPQQLERTLQLLERVAPLVDSFGTLGVVVPYPGTPIYEHFHARYGFTDWWLRAEASRYEPPPLVTDAPAFYRFYIDDVNLKLDFFHYSEPVKALIRACLQFKAEHNLRQMGLLADMPCA